MWINLGRKINRLGRIFGITQIKRYYRNEYNIEDLDEKPTLNTTGAFKIVRHPIYLSAFYF